MAWMLLTAAFCSSAWARTPDGDDEKKGGAKPPNDPASQVETLSAELKAQRAELEAQRALIESLKARKPEASGMSLEGGANPPAARGDLDFKVSFTDGFHLKSGTSSTSTSAVGPRLIIARFWTGRSASLRPGPGPGTFQIRSSCANCS